MKKIVVASILIYTSHLFGQSPAFNWVKELRLNGAGKFAIDPAGDLILASSYNGTVDMDPASTVVNIQTSNSDCVVAKYDDQGNLIWVKTIEGNGFQDPKQVVVDQERVYVCGEFTGTTDFDPGPSIYSISPSAMSGVNGFVLCLDENGQFIWVKPFGGSNNSIQTAILGSTGDIIVGGTYFGQSGFISRLSSEGSLIWSKHFDILSGFPSIFILSLATDSHENIYCGGYFATGTVDFDPNAGTKTITSSGNSGFMVKLTSAGAFAYVIPFQRVANSSDHYVRGISVDDNDFVYISGSFRNEIQLPPSAPSITLTSNNEPNGFVLKISADNTYHWVKKIGENYNAVINVKAVGDKLICDGVFKGNIDVDPGPDQKVITSLGGEDMYVIFLTDDGDYLSHLTARGTLEQINTCILHATDSLLFLSGSHRGKTTFEGSTGNTNITVEGPSSNEPSAMYLASVKGVTFLTEMSDIQFKSFAVYPNPSVTNEIYVKGDGVNPTQFRLYDSFGKLIFQTNLVRTERIYLPLAQSGIYLYRLSEGEQSTTGKILLKID